ncbi:MAG: hypothetical protein Q9159_003031 [Coniocarpon cinnabarinum]
MASLPYYYHSRPKSPKPNSRSFTATKSRRRSFSVVVLLCMSVLFYFYHGGLQKREDDLSTAAPHSLSQTLLGKPRKALIVAAMKGDDTSWLDEHLSEWERYIYVVNDPKANLTVAKNKGRESNVYLTYLIDNYDNLPDYMLFLHALRYQWHNEDPMYDGLPMIRSLRLPHVAEEGFANVRCTWMLGCPNEVKPRLDSTTAGADEYSRVRVEAAYADAHRHFFPHRPVPTEVGAHCGAQFAMTRDKVQERPRSDYEMYRKWLWDTKLDDDVSGRVLEYTWHIIMGKPSVHCPDAGDCFCEKYGLCNLNCAQDHCEKRFHLPQYATIPFGWPEYGPGQDGFPEKDWWL